MWWTAGLRRASVDAAAGAQLFVAMYDVFGAQAEKCLTE
jgi:hypothetical protein